MVVKGEKGEAAITGEPNKPACSSSAFPSDDRSAAAFDPQMEEFTDRYHCWQRLWGASRCEPHSAVHGKMAWPNVGWAVCDETCSIM